MVLAFVPARAKLTTDLPPKWICTIERCRCRRKHQNLLAALALGLLRRESKALAGNGPAEANPRGVPLQPEMGVNAVSLGIEAQNEGAYDLGRARVHWLCCAKDV